MTDQQHERCACGYPAREYKGDILCSDCRWRAPTWEQWDRVMWSVRMVQQAVPYIQRMLDAKEHDRIKLGEGDIALMLQWLKEAPDA